MSQAQAKILREKAEMFEQRAESATDPISRQHYKEMAAHYRSLAAEHLDVRRDEPAHQNGQSRRDELARLVCPVLVIGGSLDRVRPPALAESVAKSIPGARYIEIRTGHYMSVQTPDLLSDCIDEFLRSVGA